MLNFLKTEWNKLIQCNNCLMQKSFFHQLYKGMYFPLYIQHEVLTVSNIILLGLIKYSHLIKHYCKLNSGIYFLMNRFPFPFKIISDKFICCECCTPKSKNTQMSKRIKSEWLTASQTNEQIMIIRCAQASRCFLFQSQAYK